MQQASEGHAQESGVQGALAVISICMLKCRGQSMMGCIIIIIVIEAIIC